MIDNVNNPQHYMQHEIQCFDEMLILFSRAEVIGFCKCNAWKYRERAPYKGHEAEDNAKADWYLKKARELMAKSERSDFE